MPLKVAENRLKLNWVNFETLSLNKYVYENNSQCKKYFSFEDIFKSCSSRNYWCFISVRLIFETENRIQWNHQFLKLWWNFKFDRIRLNPIWFKLFFKYRKVLETHKTNKNEKSDNFAKNNSILHTRLSLKPSVICVKALTLRNIVNSSSTRLLTSE